MYHECYSMPQNKTNAWGGVKVIAGWKESVVEAAKQVVDTINKSPYNIQ